MQSHIRRRPLLAVTLGLSAHALCVSFALADPAPPFSALLAQAQSTAPRLAESRAEIAKAQGLARQAGALPNPTLGVEFENFSGSGPFKGTDLAETTASIGQTLELGGKRSARVSAGRAEIDAARARSVQVSAEFAFDLAQSYALAEASERRMQLASETLTLAQEDARIATALVEAGREADVRRVQAQAGVQAAKANVDAARSARVTAFANLTAMSGSPVPLTSIPTSLLAQAERTAPGPRPDPTASPAYLAAQGAREAAARRVRVEGSRAIPDVEVSVGLRRFQADDATAIVAGFSTSLPLFDRNRGNINAAQADLAATDARLNGARLDAEAAAGASQDREIAAQSRLLAARESEQSADEAYRLTRLGFEGGKLDLIEVLNARRALTEARTQTIDAALERLGAQAALARLAGRAPFGDQP
ncbi:TolC family protein [Phenylobacterium sp.]|uniref:TolC family protein n=1 Tax=Phenylobacterium sp. TaxID=1871053 RepID=UPI003BACB7E4